ncbi:MAG: COX15/CtaA family protein [Gammaproteobacteria bacterium]|nr:COX15/CtaA family protein [Gammaproteobacteria bacterium]
MIHERRFMTFVFAALLLTVAWLLLGTYARQVEARSVCPGWPECYRSAPALSADDTPPVAVGLDVVRVVTDGALLFALAGLVALGWARRRIAFDRRWLIPALGLALAGSATLARFADAGLPGGLWQQLAALMTLTLLWWLVLRERRFWRPLPAESAATRVLRPRALTAMALTLTAATLGGWAMVHGIGLPCPEFPACRGEWWPTGNLLTVFTATTRPDLATAILLEVSHRLGALIALIYVMWLGLHVWYIGARDHLCRYGMLVLTTLLATAGLGIMGAVTRLAPVTAVAHSAAAALLLLSLVTLYHVARPATRSEKHST